MLRRCRGAFIALGRAVLCAWLLVNVPSHAQTGPVGWWKFDDGSGTSAVDSSGNSHTETLVNSPVWATGRVNGALNFNTASAYTTAAGTGSLADLKATGVTVAAWIFPRSAGGHNTGRIVDKDNMDVGWLLRMGSSSQITFWGDSFSTGAANRLSLNGSITLNAWQHVVATWTGSATGTTIHLYVNGVQSDGTAVDGTGTVAGSDSTSPLTIGNVTADLTHGFDGLIDDVRVYNRILSTAEIQALADSTAPSAPSGLSATAASSSQINLSWTGSTDNVGVAGYLIERCQGSGCSTFTQIATVTGTSYSDTGRSASTSYSYRVRATDANTNLSSYSNTASATTPAGGGDTTPPSTPTGLTATATSSSQINLSWTASTDNVGVTGYKVERCQGASCSTFAQIATPTTTTYSDTGLTASTPYSYRVRATDAAGNLSNYSNTASASTPGGDTQPPTAPTSLAVLASSSTEVDLTWGASTDNVGVTAYLLERCTGAACSNFAQIGSQAAPPYYDTPVTPGTAYSYRVRAQDAAGNNSTYSNTLSVTTPLSSPDCN